MSIHTDNVEEGMVTDTVIETRYLPFKGFSIEDGYLRVFADDGWQDVETRIAFETLKKADIMLPDGVNLLIQECAMKYAEMGEDVERKKQQKIFDWMKQIGAFCQYSPFGVEHWYDERGKKDGGWVVWYHAHADKYFYGETLEEAAGNLACSLNCRWWSLEPPKEDNIKDD